MARSVHLPLHERVCPIVVGDDRSFTGLVVSARNRITISDAVLSGPGVVIIDADGHPLAAEGRRSASAPEPREEHDTAIGDDVFIGTRSLVLKGVTIGSGSVIGAGSVVTRSIPAGVVAAGSPGAQSRPSSQDPDPDGPRRGQVSRAPLGGRQVGAGVGHRGVRAAGRSCTGPTPGQLDRS
jgi:hypothetical protein